jgi:lipoate-protein ligase B
MPASVPSSRAAGRISASHLTQLRCFGRVRICWAGARFRLRDLGIRFAVEYILEGESMERVCEVSWLGLVDYQETWERQLRLVHERALGGIPDQLLLLEHPHVFTLGRRGRTANVLSSDEQIAAAGAQVIHSDRGGDVTYHGPGQLVGYPILHLEESERDVPRYVRQLEESIIRTLASFGIEAGREPEFPGVWVGEEKICAVGVKISEWVTLHGFALNVTTDMSMWRHIVPCGIVGKGVTSMEQLLVASPTLQEVSEQFVQCFGEVFGRRMVTRPAGVGAARG